MPSRAGRPDIEVAAALKAEKLRFEHVPDTEVRHAGEWRSATDRKNLPCAVEPGVTYRDIEIRWYVQARVAARWVDDEIDETQGGKGP